MERHKLLRSCVGRVLALLAAMGTAGRLAGQARIILPDTPTPSVKAEVKEIEPTNRGLARLICASPYGGKSNDRIVDVKVLPDHSILLAGNLNVPMSTTSAGEGFLVRLTVKDDRTVTAGNRVMLPGTLYKVEADAEGNLYLLLDGAAVYHILPGAREPTKHCVREGIRDFGVDSNGELVVLAGREIVRYDATWQSEKWKATWHAYGTNTPLALAVCPDSGVATVVGFGLAYTGRKRWRGPYAHGFSRDGKLLWTLWDQKPNKQLPKKDGGNDMAADTIGRRARPAAGGKVYLQLYAEGEKNICMRDPNDSDKRIAKSVFEGVFQDNPGKGFRARPPHTGVTFRVDARAGELEKGTWMCAWMKEGKSANRLYMNDVVTDEQGRIFLAGNSEHGCPILDPWCLNEGGYEGGGFLGIFDGDFRLLQCGYFVKAVVLVADAAHGYAVIAGYVAPRVRDPQRPLEAYRPVQKEYGGGYTDGFFAVFVTGPHGTPAALPTAVAAHKMTPEAQAARRLAEARDALTKKKLADARTKLEYLLSRYPQTASARQAKALLEQLDAKPAGTVAKPPAAPAADEKAADRLLQKAENYLANRMMSLAKRTLRELLKKYPETEAAKRGKELYERHFIE
jgi:hypothetical protein